MKVNNNIVLVSVYRSELSNEVNHANHVKAIELLKCDDVPFSVVKGNYKGNDELTLMLSTNDAKKHSDNLSNALNLAYLFNQDSVLEVHNDGTSVLHSLRSDMPSLTIGSFKEVSKQEAVSQESYTYEPVSNRYFIVK